MAQRFFICPRSSCEKATPPPAQEQHCARTKSSPLSPHLRLLHWWASGELLRPGHEQEGGTRGNTPHQSTRVLRLPHEQNEIHESEEEVSTATSTRLVLTYECDCGAQMQAHGSDVVTAPWCGDCRKPMKAVAR